MVRDINIFESKHKQFTGVAQEATSLPEVPQYSVYRHPFLKFLTGITVNSRNLRAAKQRGLPDLVTLCRKLTLATREAGTDTKYLF